MAEDEVRKHAKAAIKIFSDHKSSWQHKLKDIILEILIIVFAVSISIWFHNLSDKYQQRREQREFLTGFKKDLKNDIENIDSSRSFYENTLNGMLYFSKIGTGDSLNNDSLIKYGNIFFSSTELEPHISRYEALKNSGKFGIIEDKELLNKIIDLNESTLSNIQLLNGIYGKSIERISVFIQQNLQFNRQGNITNQETLLRNPQMRFLLSLGRSTIDQNVIPAHNEGIKKCYEIIQQIDKELQ
jgi:hypothetical protein